MVIVQFIHPVGGKGDVAKGVDEVDSYFSQLQVFFIREYDNLV